MAATTSPTSLFNIIILIQAIMTKVFIKKPTEIKLVHLQKVLLSHPTIQYWIEDSLVRLFTSSPNGSAAYRIRHTLVRHFLRTLEWIGLATFSSAGWSFDFSKLNSGLEWNQIDQESKLHHRSEYLCAQITTLLRQRASTQTTRELTALIRKRDPNQVSKDQMTPVHTVLDVLCHVGLVSCLKLSRSIDGWQWKVLVKNESPNVVIQ